MLVWKFFFFFNVMSNDDCDYLRLCLINIINFLNYAIRRATLFAITDTYSDAYKWLAYTSLAKVSLTRLLLYMSESDFVCCTIYRNNTTIQHQYYNNTNYWIRKALCQWWYFFEPVVIKKNFSLFQPQVIFMKMHLFTI